ncbi:MAG: iron-sulfur cluster repair di-iron protein, ric [Alkalibacterium sp.]|nr:iron-sulfur cluster repair di-iron protein, ric [Alkalibacterium sp.]
MTEFKTVVNDYFPKLELYTLPLTRAHGKKHPEVLAVHELFQTIQKKVKASDSDRPELDNDFRKLREVTDHYALPSDACETYEAVYRMLSEADEAYSAEQRPFQSR